MQEHHYALYLYLQYKMFLLNDVNEQMFLSEFAFTIQNVPIKSSAAAGKVTWEDNLQYKMFLLNKIHKIG